MAPAEFGPEPPSIGLPNTVFFLGTGGGEIEDWTAGNQSFGFESVVGKASWLVDCSCPNAELDH